MPSNSKPTVVLVGANGTVGPYTIQALLSPTFRDLYSLPIRIVTRDAAKAAAVAESFSETDSDLAFYTADIESGEGLDKAFDGADVVVNLLGSGLSHAKVPDAAKAAGIKLYLPSEYGSNIPTCGEYQDLFKIKTDALAYAQGLGLKTVSIDTGAFAEWVLTIPPLAGVNFPSEGQILYFGDVDTKFTVTSLVDLGNTIASVVSKDPATLPERVVVKSDFISAQTIHDVYLKVTGKDLKLDGQPLEAITDKALKIVREGPRSMEDFVVGLRGLMSSGQLNHVGVDNEFVSKGLFEFTSFEAVAERVLQK